MYLQRYIIYIVESIHIYLTSYIISIYAYTVYAYIYICTSNTVLPIGTINTSHFHLPAPPKKQVFTQVSMAGGGERPRASFLAGGGTLDHRP